VLFQHGGHAGLITAATGLVRLDRAFFKAQRDQNLAWFFLLAALAAFAFLRMCGEIGKGLLLTFALCSPKITVCAIGCHARFVFNSCPSVAPTNAAVIVGIVLS
jgi:hypothetical protein